MTRLRGYVTDGLRSPVEAVNTLSNDYKNAAHSLTRAA